MGTHDLVARPEILDTVAARSSGEDGRRRPEVGDDPPVTEVRRRPHPTSSRLRVALLAVAAVVLVALVATTVVVLVGGDPTRDRDGRGATVCSSMTLPVRYLVDPGTRNARFTTTPEQAAATAATGFTQDEGILFRVAARPADGLAAVHQLQKGGGDQLWSVNPSEVRDAVAALGYTDQGVVAYVATSDNAC